jgi:lipid-binding SYLF domain-containing protein
VALEDLVSNPENAIPSAILNRTKCLVFVPSQVGKSTDDAPGIESCRDSENSWSSPQLLQFSIARNHQMDPGDLVFLLNKSASQQLHRGELKLKRGSNAAAGPAIRDANLATNAELDKDIWTYVREKGLIVGKTLPGTLRLQNSSGQAKETTFQQIVNKSRSGDLNARFEASAISFFNAITPTGIIIHHSGIIPANHQVPTDETQVDRFHQQRGFETICFGRMYHVAYHFLIFPNGQVEAGRPERCQGAHAPGYNSYLGISLVGDFSSIDNPHGKKGNTRPTTKQMKSLVLLCRRIAWQYDMPLQRILRHSDVSSTLCPGDRFPFTSFLRQLESQ